MLTRGGNSEPIRDATIDLRELTGSANHCLDHLTTATKGQASRLLLYVDFIALQSCHHDVIPFRPYSMKDGRESLDILSFICDD